MKKPLLVLFGLLLIGSQVSKAQLAAGDIAFIGFNEDAGPTSGHDHSFAWIALTDIPGSEVIYFTDEGWDDDANSWVGNTEAHMKWTAPGGGVSCGTVVYFTETGTQVYTVIGGGSATNIQGSWNFSGGDQVLAYQGASADPVAPTFIAGIQTDDGGAGSGTNATTQWHDNAPYGGNSSGLPAGLTNGVNCVSLYPTVFTEQDNNKYTGTLTGTSAALRTLINNRTNWSNHNTTPFDITPSGFSSSVTCGPAVGTWDGSTSTDWNVATNWSADQIPTSSDNVTIPSAPSNQPHVTLAPATPAVCNNITVESGATLTIDAGKALTVSGTLANAGTVDIKASASGIGSLITNGTVSGAGSFKAEQYLTGSGGGTPDGLFYYISSPIPNATASDYNVATGNKLWAADETAQTYPQLTYGPTALAVGAGFIARMGSTGAVIFDGSSYNTGNITEGSLSRTGTTETNRGYNLVGNPYPSTVNWDDLATSNLTTTMYYRTNDGSSMVVDTYNSSGGSGTNNNGTTVTGVIPPTQAFWVLVSGDGLTGSVSFENADRSHGTATSIYKAAAEEGMLRINLSDGNVSDEQIILFNPSAEASYEDYDSQKFWSSNVPQLYSNIAEDTLTINGLNNPVSTPSVNLGIKVLAQGSYTLNATSITFTETPVYLEDTELNIFQNLSSTPIYPFSSEAGNIGDRFVLHFSEVTGINEAENIINAFSIDNSFHVNLSKAETGTITVLDMSGRMVHTQPINSNRIVIDLNTAAGIYVVQVETSAKTITKKISIQ